MFQKLFSQNVYVRLNKMDATLRIRKTKQSFRVFDSHITCWISLEFQGKIIKYENHSVFITYITLAYSITMLALCESCFF